MTRLVFLLAFVPLALQTAAPAQPATNTSPATTTAGADPAAVTFASDRGMLLVTVKGEKIPDYEAVVLALQDALSKASDERQRKIAAGWRVFKATEGDAKNAAIYLHFIDPVVDGADYRPSMVLDELLAGAPADLLAKYRAAIASGPTKLTLVEIANMAKPVTKPANASPAGPTPPGKPGNASPAGPEKPGNKSPETPLI